VDRPMICTCDSPKLCPEGVRLLLTVKTLRQQQFGTPGFLRSFASSNDRSEPFLGEL
jgi:hypothetical protein